MHLPNQVIDASSIATILTGSYATRKAPWIAPLYVRCSSWMDILCSNEIIGLLERPTKRPSSTFIWTWTSNYVLKSPTSINNLVVIYTALDVVFLFSSLKNLCYFCTITLGFWNLRFPSACTSSQHKKILSLCPHHLCHHSSGHYP